MKRTYPANIDGQIFYIDEDAFLLLQNYLNQLKLTFPGAEGHEIVSDIESRIRELFAEKVAAGAGVIVLADVNTVIETMGRPEDLSDADGDFEESAADATRRDTSGYYCPPQPETAPARKRLYRNMKNKVFGGVVGGLATYLGWNANVMRIFLIIIACCTHIWPLVLIYLAGWMIIPPAVTPREVLQMHGQPINVDTIGQAVMADSPTPPADVFEKDNSNFFSEALGIIGKGISAVIGLMIGCVGFCLIIAFLAILSGVLSLTLFDSPIILQSMELFPYFHGGMIGVFAILVWLMVGIIVSVALTWAACSVLFKTNGASRTTKIVWLVIVAILIALGVVLLFMAAAV